MTRGMIFAGQFIPGLMDGTKTQTRRPCKRQLRKDHYLKQTAVNSWWPHFMTPEGEMVCVADGPWLSPYGVPGDRIWVRETFGIRNPYDMVNPDKKFVYYKADYPKEWSDCHIFKPSIHMPRWASRITLEITKVRVQRIQEISEEDARAEGFEQYSTVCARHKIINPCGEQFARTWNSIYPGSWTRNDWVWCYTFRRLHACS